MSVATPHTHSPQTHKPGKGGPKIFIEKSTASEIRAALGIGPREERAAQKAIRAVTTSRSAVSSRPKPHTRKRR